MNTYFTNEERAFTPKGYLSVCHAVVRCALKWHEVDLSEFINNSNVSPDLLDNAAHESAYNEEITLIKTWKRLRQSLYDGTVGTRTIRSETGQTIDLPPQIWGSSKTDSVLYDGTIGESFHAGEFDGRAILSEADLQHLLDGIPKPSIEGPPQQSLVILAPSNPDTTSAYLPLGYIGIKEAYKAFFDKIRATAPSPQSSEEVINQSHELYEQAGKEISAALASGVLPSYHLQMSGGTVRSIKATDWLPDGPVFKSVTSSVVSRYPGGWYDKVAMSTPNGAVLGTVVVSAEDLLRILRGSAENLSVEPGTATKLSTVIQLPDRGGRPARYDGELFLIEAAKAILDRVPETQAQLIERTLEAYEAAGHPGGRPSPDWAKGKIRPLWRRLELGEKR